MPTGTSSSAGSWRKSQFKRDSYFLLSTRLALKLPTEWAEQRKLLGFER